MCVSPIISCGICDFCLLGDQVGCTGYTPKLMYGIVPTAVPPSLWGGYSTHAFVPRSGVVFKVPPHVGALDATLWQPIAGAHEWAVTKGG